MPRQEELVDEDDIKIYEDDPQEDTYLELDEPETQGGRRLYKAADTEDDLNEDDDEDSGDDETETSNKTLNELKQKLSATEFNQRKMELGMARGELKDLENRYNFLASEASKAAAIKSEAISSSDGQLVMQAEDLMERSIKEANQIAQVYNTAKETLAREEQEIAAIERGSTQNYANPVGKNPAVAEMADEFRERVSWEQLGTKQKRAIENLDNRLAGEGYSPAHPRYWSLLESRCKKAGYLNGEQSMTSNKRGPPTGGAANRNTQSSRSPKDGVYISAERKEALISAGVWDDHVLRARYVRQYQKWDKENL